MFNCRGNKPRDVFQAILWGSQSEQMPRFTGWKTAEDGYPANISLSLSTAQALLNSTFPSLPIYKDLIVMILIWYPPS